MTTIPFDSVHEALYWFFNEQWVEDSKPADARSIDLRRDLGGKKQPYCPKSCDVPKTWDAAKAMRHILDRLTARNYYIIAAYYHRHGATQAEVALDCGLLGGDRSVRRIKDEVIKKVQADILAAGIVRPPKQGETKYAEDSTAVG